jgi:hypothetical protein
MLTGSFFIDIQKDIRKRALRKRERETAARKAE